MSLSSIFVEIKPKTRAAMNDEGEHQLVLRSGFANHQDFYQTLEVTMQHGLNHIINVRQRHYIRQHKSEL